MSLLSWIESSSIVMPSKPSGDVDVAEDITDPCDDDRERYAFIAGCTHLLGHPLSKESSQASSEIIRS